MANESSASFLMLWNPEVDPDSGLEFAEAIYELVDGEPFECSWRMPIGNPRPGDIAFVKCGTRGVNPGIFAKGVFTSERNRQQKSVKLVIDSVLPPGLEFPLEMLLNEEPFAADGIRFQMASGGRLSNESTTLLLDKWPRLTTEMLEQMSLHEFSFLPERMWPDDFIPGHLATEYLPAFVDERKSVEKTIAERRGQAKFRRLLIDRHGARCQITGCKVEEVLEAAHIIPYRSDNDNHFENGLLLRADIHTLFDLNLIGICPESRDIILDSSIYSHYVDVVSHRLICKTSVLPSKEALKVRFEYFQNER